jgi:hypothetical protein
MLHIGDSNLAQIPAPVVVIRSSALWIKSGETTDTHGQGSDGFHEIGRGGGWGILSELNVFGTYDRFTNTTGGTSFATDKIMLDHECRDQITKLIPGYDIADVLTARTWDAHRTYGNSKVKDGFTGWMGLTDPVINSLRKQGSTYSLNWFPLNWAGGTMDYFYSFSTNNGAPAEAWLFYNYSTVPVQSRAKVGSYFAMFYRMFTLTDDGVLS